MQSLGILLRDSCRFLRNQVKEKVYIHIKHRPLQPMYQPWQLDSMINGLFSELEMCHGVKKYAIFVESNFQLALILEEEYMGKYIMHVTNNSLLIAKKGFDLKAIWEEVNALEDAWNWNS